MTQNVLVVQHHSTIFADAVQALNQGGLTVAALNTVQMSDYLLRWAATAFDGLLLDAGLNGGRGHELCTKLRCSGYAGAILMFGAAPDENAVIACLEAGADDVLAPTLGAAELVARVQAQLRHGPRRRSPTLASVRRAA